MYTYAHSRKDEYEKTLPAYQKRLIMTQRFIDNEGRSAGCLHCVFCVHTES